MKTDLMTLAIVSKMSYDSIVEMSVDERVALSEALKLKAEAEEKAYKSARR
jgi:hypothetical protein